MLKQKTVYFREEDLPLWEAVENKAEWLHNALTDFSTYIVDPTPKSKQNQILPPIIKTKEDAEKVVAPIKKPVTVTPKTNWGA